MSSGQRVKRFLPARTPGVLRLMLRRPTFSVPLQRPHRCAMQGSKRG
ncbi:hypothetical protein PAMC26510_29660 [Caballeronia sordidicola]|uniref:Uncharacterized protein n=1 Tax=Caballeronia sordidicola TaxID=196367 RepID=A0A242MA29_CABSO|nr:hypothetical protein PAMC26510_29660 [Caballeronia sordidicola]